MTCKPDILRSVPLFALLDDDETAVLAGQVDVRNFAARERIYKMGEPSQHAYVMVSGKIRVSTVDEDQQEVVVDEPSKGDFFGFASMLEQTPHQTTAIALEDTVCLEVSRDDIAVLLQRKPHAGMDLLATLGRQFHAAQQLVRAENPWRRRAWSPPAAVIFRRPPPALEPSRMHPGAHCGACRDAGSPRRQPFHSRPQPGRAYRQRDTAPIAGRRNGADASTAPLPGAT